MRRHSSSPSLSLLDCFCDSGTILKFFCSIECLFPFMENTSLTQGLRWPGRDTRGFKHQLDVWSRRPLKFLSILRVCSSDLISWAIPPLPSVDSTRLPKCSSIYENALFPTWTLGPGINLSDQFGKAQCSSCGTRSTDHVPAASAPPGSLLEMQNLRSIPDLLNQNLPCTRSSGDSYNH